MPLNGRSARAGALRAAGFFRAKAMGRCPAWRLRRGAVSRQSREAEMIEFGRGFKKRQLARIDKVTKTGCRYARARGAPQPLQHFVKHCVQGLMSITLTASAGRAVLVRAETPCRARRFRCRSAQISRGGIVGGVLRARRFRNRKHRWRARQKRQRDLARRSPCASAIVCSTSPRLAARRRKIIVAERRIGDDRDAVLLAPRNHRVLDRAFLQMIEHLVAGDPALARDREQFVEIVGIEIADAPGADFSGARPVPRTPRPSPRADRSRASAADSNRDDRSSAASANARRR